MASFESDFDLLKPPRRHSWPEAEQTIKPWRSGIFEPLPDQEEIFLRSSMTSRSSNYSTAALLQPSNSVTASTHSTIQTRSCIYALGT